MADDPEAVRLARNWRANTPPDRSPAYIADDLARSVLSQHDENTRLRAALAEGAAKELSKICAVARSVGFASWSAAPTTNTAIRSGGRFVIAEREP